VHWGRYNACRCPNLPGPCTACSMRRSRS
jgi:hypothetical protein